MNAAVALVRRSATGRIALARLAPLVVAEAIPEPVRADVAERLAAAEADACRPLAAREVERVLRGAWRRPPREVLDELDPEPLAVRAQTQVHRGVLDGAPVAVKVRRPGLEVAVRADLVLLEGLVAPLGAVFGAADARRLVREARRIALDELDLEFEGANQRLVRRLLRGATEVAVPAVHTGEMTPDVLVCELLDGLPLGAAAPPDPRAAARALLHAHVVAAARGWALADARPSHVLVLRDGGIGLLGAGLAHPIERGRVALLLNALQALRADDHAGFAAAAGALGLLPDDAVAAEAHDLLRDVLGALLTGPARLDGAALGAVVERWVDTLAAQVALAAHVTPQPGDLALARGLGQLASVLARLGASEDWTAMALASGHAA